MKIRKMSQSHGPDLWKPSERPRSEKKENEVDEREWESLWGDV
jgi:hypothetical protein